ncbi:hypothetical protein TELCIR_21758, partial [Teladorsagia circumcincta]
LPYTIYLTANWNPTYLDMNPYYVLILGTPLVVQLKINLTLTIAIALERTLALLFPVTYRKFPASKYAMYCLLIGCLLGTVDLVVQFVLTSFHRSPQCGAFGCFISKEFRYYMGNSNMAMGFVVIVLVTFLIVKLHVMQRHSEMRRISQPSVKESSMFTQ